jgi:hypothetical protein
MSEKSKQRLFAEVVSERSDERCQSYFDGVGAVTREEKDEAAFGFLEGLIELDKKHSIKLILR